MKELIFGVMTKYFNASIEESLNTENTLVKILVILDRKIGKRTLINMEESIEN